jgi:hexosaminidase
MKTPKYLIIYILFMSILGLSFACNQAKVIYEIKGISLIPLPQTVKNDTGTFILLSGNGVEFDEKNAELSLIYNYLKNQLKDFYQFELISDKNAGIKLSIDKNIENDEGYSLIINKKGIEIKGKTPRGLFYGIQSFLQILPAEKKKIEGFKIPCITIIDEPQFKWRGLHLDVCRHFFTVEEVKKLLDVVASLKINTFHWHLTDDQGWRIQIKKYPKLTEIGSWRKANLLNYVIEYPLKYDNQRYGGFYTQEQIKEVVEYAKTRFITIVPEIEMPGHAVAALTAYPEYSCTGGPFEVLTEWGVSDDVFCPGKDATFNFIQDILSEVIDLFPGEYIHVGGDECPKVRWKHCPDCQNRMKAENLKNENELQSYFIKRIEKFLNSKGKKLIGWDEILEGGLPERANVMSWRGESGGIQAASNGHNVVMTPNNDCYFDHYQGKYNEPLSIGGLTTLKDVYDYQPVPKNLDEKFRKHILGSQANLWAEYIPTSEHLEYMIFPRLCALVENLWTYENRHNYKDFLQRMDTEYLRLDLKKINYRVNPPEGFEDINKTIDDSVLIKLDNGISSSTIRYTLDGSEPNETSLLYKAPFMLKLDKKQNLKVITIMQSSKKSQVITGTFEKYKFAEPIQNISPEKGINFIYYEDTVLTAIEIKAKETKQGVINNIKIPTGSRAHFFGLSFMGYINITDDDIYTFYLASDDGSVLYINNEMVVNNNGFHWWEEKSGKIALKKGLHPFKMNYFQAKYNYNLDGISIESSKLKKQAVTDNMLFH